MSRRAVFLDRDGTLNELVAAPTERRPESPLQVADVALIPGAATAARRLMDADWQLIGVTNQPAAAKGTTTMAELAAVQEQVLLLLAEAGVRFLDFRVCHHHPQGTHPELSKDCDCRKPKPGMLLDAAQLHDLDLSTCWMVGDTDADVLAGAAAGCRTVLLENPDSAHKRGGAVAPTFTVPDLATAVIVIRNTNW